MRTRIGLFLVFALSAHGQGSVSNRTTTGTVDDSGAVSTKPVKAAASLPGTCGVTELFYLTSATAGQNLYGCTSTNTWSIQSGTATAGGSTGDIQRNNAGVFSAANIKQQSDGSLLASKAIDWASCQTQTTGSNTITVDFSASNCTIITLIDSASALAVSNPHGSGMYGIVSCQDPSGSRAWASFASTLKGFSQPFSTASTCTQQTFIFDGTNYSGEVASCPLCAPFIGLAGSTSGLIQLKAPSAAGNNSVTFPAGTIDFSATGGTSQVVKQTSSGGALTVAQLSASDLSNGTSGTGAVCLASGSACGGTSKTYIPDRFQVAGCQAGGVTYNLISYTGAVTPGCIGGTNNVGGNDLFNPSSYSGYFELNEQLPSDWDTTQQPWVKVAYHSNSATSGTIQYTLSVACFKNDGTQALDPGFNSESPMGAQTMTAGNQSWSQSMQLTQATSAHSCVAGGTMLVKIQSTGSTANSAGLTSASVTVARNNTAQAN